MTSRPAFGNIPVSCGAFYLAALQFLTSRLPLPISQEKGLCSGIAQGMDQYGQSALYFY
jgi:hypothetical protein